MKSYNHCCRWYSVAALLLIMLACILGGCDGSKDSDDLDNSSSAAGDLSDNGDKSSPDACDGEIIYVPSMKSNDLTLVDLKSGEIIDSVPDGSIPSVTAITRDGGKVFTANFFTHYVTVLDTAKLTTKRIRIGGTPFAALMSRDSREVYVPFGKYMPKKAKLAVIDVETNTVARTFDFDVEDCFGYGVELSPDGSILYISFTNNTIAAYDAHTGEMIHEPIDCGGEMPAWLSLSPDGSTLYSLNGLTGNTTVFDTGNWEEKGDIKDTADSIPITAAISPDESKIYIAGANGVTIADTTDYEIIGRLKTEGSAANVTFSSEGYGYVSDTRRCLSCSVSPDSNNPLQLLSLAFKFVTSKTTGMVRRFDPATDTFDEPGIEVSLVPSVIAIGPKQCD